MPPFGSSSSYPYSSSSSSSFGFGGPPFGSSVPPSLAAPPSSSSSSSSSSPSPHLAADAESSAPAKPVLFSLSAAPHSSSRAPSTPPSSSSGAGAGAGAGPATPENVANLLAALSKQQREIETLHALVTQHDERARLSSDLINALEDKVEEAENDRASTVRALVAIVGKKELVSKLQDYKAKLEAGKLPAGAAEAFNKGVTGLLTNGVIGDGTVKRSVSRSRAASPIRPTDPLPPPPPPPSGMAPAYAYGARPTAMQALPAPPPMPSFAQPSQPLPAAPVQAQPRSRSSSPTHAGQQSTAIALIEAATRSAAGQPFQTLIRAAPSSGSSYYESEGAAVPARAFDDASSIVVPRLVQTPTAASGLRVETVYDRAAHAARVQVMATAASSAAPMSLARSPMTPNAFAAQLLASTTPRGGQGQVQGQVQGLTPNALAASVARLGAAPYPADYGYGASATARAFQSRAASPVRAGSPVRGGDGNPLANLQALAQSDPARFAAALGRIAGAGGGAVASSPAVAAALASASASASSSGRAPGVLLGAISRASSPVRGTGAGGAAAFTAPPSSSASVASASASRASSPSRMRAVSNQQLISEVSALDMQLQQEATAVLMTAAARKAQAQANAQARAQAQAQAQMQAQLQAQMQAQAQAQAQMQAIAQAQAAMRAASYSYGRAQTQPQAQQQQQQQQTHASRFAVQQQQQQQQDAQVLRASSPERARAMASMYAAAAAAAGRKA
jgi:hypothetical protein